MRHTPLGDHFRSHGTKKLLGCLQQRTKLVLLCQLRRFLLSRAASRLCSLSSSLIAARRISLFSRSTPKSFDSRGIGISSSLPFPLSMNTTLVPSVIPYFLRMLTGMLIMLLLVTLAVSNPRQPYFLTNSMY